MHAIARLCPWYLQEVCAGCTTVTQSLCTASCVGFAIDSEQRRVALTSDVQTDKCTLPSNVYGYFFILTALLSYLPLLLLLLLLQQARAHYTFTITYALLGFFPTLYSKLKQF
jgi:hypothetical protein